MRGAKVLTGQLAILENARKKHKVFLDHLFQDFHNMPWLKWIKSVIQHSYFWSWKFSLNGILYQLQKNNNSILRFNTERASWLRPPCYDSADIINFFFSKRYAEIIEKYSLMIEFIYEKSTLYVESDDIFVCITLYISN